MKTLNATNTRSRYESPAVQTASLRMESVSCQSNGTLENVNITDPYAGDDLG